MKQHYEPRSDFKHGRVTVEFENGFHLRNSIHFAQDQAMTGEFYAALGRLISLASADAAPASPLFRQFRGGTRREAEDLAG